jgi:hypothetical protein
MQISGLFQDGEQTGDDGILRCGKPAAHLESYWDEMYFCDKHARACKAPEEAEHVVDSQHSRFLYNKKIMRNNRVMCTTKSCGKTAEGYLPYLPDGWRVVLVAPGSVFKRANRVQAKTSGLRQ